MAITYSTEVSDLKGLSIDGFFTGWPDPPTTFTLKHLLAGSYRVVLAIESDRLIGFVTAISDGVLNAFIPLIEVLPGRRHEGIGTELLRHMLALLDGLYAVDLVCDDDLAPFYDRFDFVRLNAMCRRDYSAQSGHG